MEHRGSDPRSGHLADSPETPRHAQPFSTRYLQVHLHDFLRHGLEHAGGVENLPRRDGTSYSGMTVEQAERALGDEGRARRIDVASRDANLNQGAATLT